MNERTEEDGQCCRMNRIGGSGAWSARQACSGASRPGSSGLARSCGADEISHLPQPSCRVTVGHGAADVIPARLACRCCVHKPVRLLHLLLLLCKPYRQVGASAAQVGAWPHGTWGQATVPKRGAQGKRAWVLSPPAQPNQALPIHAVSPPARTCVDHSPHAGRVAPQPTKQASSSQSIRTRLDHSLHARHVAHLILLLQGLPDGRHTAAHLRSVAHGGKAVGKGPPGHAQRQPGLCKRSGSVGGVRGGWLEQNQIDKLWLTAQAEPGRGPRWQAGWAS